MTNNDTNTLITAQVACEAIINSDGAGYNRSTLKAVLDASYRAGVSSLYRDEVFAILNRSTED
jgi:hypothetical protein